VCLKNKLVLPIIEKRRYLALDLVILRATVSLLVFSVNHLQITVQSNWYYRLLQSSVTASARNSSELAVFLPVRQHGGGDSRKHHSEMVPYVSKIAL
jgi:hypothetical protein